MHHSTRKAESAFRNPRRPSGLIRVRMVSGTITNPGGLSVLFAAAADPRKIGSLRKAGADGGKKNFLRRLGPLSGTSNSVAWKLTENYRSAGIFSAGKKNEIAGVVEKQH